MNHMLICSRSPSWAISYFSIQGNKNIEDGEQKPGSRTTDIVPERFRKSGAVNERRKNIIRIVEKVENSDYEIEK